jgi:hypothetical protein
MHEVEAFPGLNAMDREVFGLLCERALATGDLLDPMSLPDVASGDTLARLGGETSQSLTVLLELGYVHRSGRHRYVLTRTGFQRYARANIVGYGLGEEAIKQALAGVEQTTTDAVMEQTGLGRQLVNHVLSLLQRDREIGGFLTASGNYCITRVASTLKQRREIDAGV